MGHNLCAAFVGSPITSWDTAHSNSKERVRGMVFHRTGVGILANTAIGSELRGGVLQTEIGKQLKYDNVASNWEMDLRGTICVQNQLIFDLLCII